MKPLLDIIHRHKSGEMLGVYSVCSSHPLVLAATLRPAWNRVIGIVVRPGVAQVLRGYARACVPAASFEIAHINRGEE